MQTKYGPIQLSFFVYLFDSLNGASNANLQGVPLLTKLPCEGMANMGVGA